LKETLINAWTAFHNDAIAVGWREDHFIGIPGFQSPSSDGNPVFGERGPFNIMSVALFNAAMILVLNILSQVTTTDVSYITYMDAHSVSIVCTATYMEALEIGFVSTRLITSLQVVATFGAIE